MDDSDESDALASAGVTDHDKLAAIDHELSQIQNKIYALEERREYLLGRKQALKDRQMLKKSEAISSRDWEATNFPWSNNVKNILQDTFNVKEFRPYQLPAINAVLSKEDTILIMPTGGGKSLCFQIPALVSKGFGLVVSPLVSLMEDQIMSLEKCGIAAYMLSANSSKEDNQRVLTAMTDPKAPMKILYATPERLAKSKRFMSKLQKAFELGLLSAIAIDEVHCCSQWGHDFRPDYKYLGVLRAMFPGVPLLGVTATATTKIIVDVQKMLDIPGCLVLKATFNRPNLHYEVKAKPSGQLEMIDELVHLLKGRYRGQTGIIYTTSIKDSEDIYQKLKDQGISAAYYHAMMEASSRTKAHQLWADGKLQVIIATVAFGMGIDKPDVRFVIHHAVPKSMESLYQESGRAGRDGKNSDCILYFRLPDVFKVSTMVFTTQTGLENLYNVVKYCLDSSRCRRQQIAYYFDETWDSTDCNKMCDFCRNPTSPQGQDIGHHCRVLYKLIEHAAGQDVKVTYQKLMDLWFNKGSAKLRLPDHKPPAIPTTKAEAIIGHLLVNGYLKEEFNYTPYSTLTYLKRGPMAGAALRPNHVINMGGASSTSSSSRGTTSTSSARNEKDVKAAESKRPRTSVSTSNDDPEDSTSKKKMKSTSIWVSDSD